MKGTALATVLMTATASLGFLQSLTPVRSTALSFLLLENGMAAAYAVPQGPWSNRLNIAARKSIFADSADETTYDDTKVSVPQPRPMHRPPGSVNGTGSGRPHHCHRPPHGNMTFPAHHSPHGPHGGKNGTSPMGPPHHKCHKPHHGRPPKDNEDSEDCWCEPDPEVPPGSGNSTTTDSVPGTTAMTPDPSATLDPTVTVDPGATFDPTATTDPTATVDPGASTAPSITTDPSATADPGVTSDPNITIDPSATATV